MPLPDVLTIITVTGTYVDLVSGDPLVGYVLFDLLPDSTVDGVMVRSNRFKALLDLDGSFSIDLPASNDPAMLPNTGKYRVSERFPTGRKAPYYIDVPYDAPGGTLDLSSVVPVDPDQLTLLESAFVKTAHLASDETAKGAALVQIPQLFSLNLMPMTLDRQIANGAVPLRALGYGLTDGVNACNANINALLADLEEAGGGEVYAERVDSINGFYKLLGPILMHNGVKFRGAGRGSIFRNLQTDTATGRPGVNECAIFHGFGVAEKNYGDLARWDLNAISAGATNVSFVNIADASNFPVGAAFLIFSKDGESPRGTIVSSIPAGGTTFEPFFSEQNKVVSNVGGVLGLKYKIDRAVPHPVASDGTGGLFGLNPTRIVDGFEASDIRCYSEDAGYGKPTTGGGFECVFERFHVDKARCFVIANAMSHCEFRYFRGIFTERPTELATGSHDTVIEHFYGDYQLGTGAAGGLILAGEYTHNNTMRDLRYHAPDFFFTDGAITAINLGRVSGLKITDFKMTLPGRGIVMVDLPASGTDNVEISDGEFTLSGQNYNITIGDTPKVYDYTPTRIVLRDLRFLGDAPSTAGVNFGLTCEVDIDRCDFNGTVKVDAGVVVSGKITRCGITGWSGARAQLDPINKLGNYRQGSPGFCSARQANANVAITTAVANTPVNTFILPVGSVVARDDEFIVEAWGTITGATQAKSIAFAHAHADGTSSSVLQTITVLAADTGVVRVQVVVRMEANNVFDYYGQISYPVGANTVSTPVSGHVTGVNVLANGLAIALQAWVAAAGPTITFGKIDIRAKPYGE